MASNDRMMAAMAHISVFFGYVFPILGNILAPFIVWQIGKKDSELVDQHGKEAINFQISSMIYGFVFAALALGYSVPAFFEIIKQAEGNPMAGEMIVEFFFERMFIFVPAVIVLTLVMYVPLIIGIIKALNGQTYHSMFTIRFIK